MDGVHDLGGKPGFGRVDRQGAEEVFHGRWEAKVFAMLFAGLAAGAWRNTDRFRHAIERINPEAYLNHGYYGRWLGGIETLLVEAGVVTRAEISRRARSFGAMPEDLIASRPSMHPDPQGPIPSGADAKREVAQPPRFSVGDSVMTTSKPHGNHTRLPAYARGKIGNIQAHHDGWVFPDTNAHGLGENPQHLYTVTFTSEILWGRAGFSVNLDLFESYLQETDLQAIPEVIDV